MFQTFRWLVIPISVAATLISFLAYAQEANAPVNGEMQKKHAAMQSDSSGEQGLIYIPQGPADRIAVLDASTLKLIKTLPGGSNPHGLGISPDGKYLYVPSLSSNIISVIDTSKGKIIKSIDIGEASHHVAVSPTGKHVYVTLSSADTVAVIDASTYQVVAMIPVGINPDYPQFSPDGKYAYVTNMNSNSVSVINAAKLSVVESIDVGKLPNHLIVAPDGKYIYVSNLGSDTVSVINAEKNKVTATINVGDGPHGIAITPDGKKVFVANSEDASFSVIETANNTVIDTVDVGDDPNHVTVSLKADVVYMGQPDAEKLLIIDSSTNKVLSKINVFAPTHQMALAGGNVEQSAQLPAIQETSTANNATITVEQKLNEKALSRKNKDDQVMINVTFMNPLLKSTEQDLVFKVTLNTHMGSLKDYKLEKLATLKNSAGVQANGGGRWISDADSKHHRSGFLKFKKQTDYWGASVDGKTEYIILELNNIGGTSKQAFQWDKKLLDAGLN